MRLTRRGRRVVVAAVVAGLLCLSGAVVLATTGDAGASVGQAPVPAPAARVHVLAPGQTLWDVALRYFPRVDPRQTVARLEEVNHLDGALVPAGRLLRLPVSPTP